MKKLWLLALILVCESLLTGFIPHSKGYLFGLLELKSADVWTALLIFGANIFFLDCFQSVKGYIILKASLLFRKDTTHDVITKKLHKISTIGQRVQEDIKLKYLNHITVLSEYFISGTIVLQLLVLNWHYPVLTISALAYATVSVLIAMLFNPKLTVAEKAVQQAEAMFRKDIDASRCLSRLVTVNNTCLSAGRIRLGYALFTKAQLCILTVLPYLVLLPGYLLGEYGLGEVMKHQATFGLIVVNAAILIQLYPTLIQGRASAARVEEMIDKESDQ